MMETVAHERAQELFGPFIDGEIAPAEAADLRQHLSGCVECRSGFDQYEKAVTLLRDTGREHAPEGFATTVLRRVRRRRRQSRFAGGRLIELNPIPAAEVIVPILIAAAVALLIVVAAP